MKDIKMIFLLIAVLLTFAGCSNRTVEQVHEAEGTVVEEETATVVEEIPDPEELLIWSYTDDFLTEIKAFEEANNAVVTVEIVEMQGLAPMLNGLIKSGQTLPDVVVTDEGGLHSEMLTDFWMDLSEISVEQEADQKLMHYIYDSGLNDDGIPIGFGYQATPMAIFYRRSIAAEVFGTDDPLLMVEKFSDYNQMMESAKALSTAGYKIFPDIFTVRYFTGLNDNWIQEDGTFEVPIQVRDYLEMIKTFQFEEYVGYLSEWSTPWLEGMYKNVTVENQGEAAVFSYVLPSWALKNVLMLAGPDEQPIWEAEDSNQKIFNPTMGDWGMAEILNPQYMGSSYVGLNKDTTHLDLAGKFIEYIVFDDEHQLNWFSETDMISSLNDVQREQSFTIGNEFLGGQDYQKKFGNIANQIEYIRLADTWLDTDELTIQTKEEYIKDFYLTVVMDFIQGEYRTVDEALRDLKKNASTYKMVVTEIETTEATDQDETTDDSETDEN